MNSALAANPVPGKICPKVNVSVVFDGVKYKCTKVAGKLKWNSGTPIEVVSPPSPKPSPIQFLTVPAPNLGELRTEIECLKGTCFYDGPIPEGSIIKLKSLKDEWNSYGTSNGITQIFFKLTSPSGKIVISPKYNLPYGYDNTSWTTAEIGTWNLQIAGWNGSQQTEWSIAKSIQVKVLPQSANGLSKCSPELETALLGASKLASTYLKEIDYGWAKRQEVKNKYDYALNFDRKNADAYLTLVMQWDSYVSERYGFANGLLASYEKTKKTCNTQVDFPKIIDIRK